MLRRDQPASRRLPGDAARPRAARALPRSCRVRADRASWLAWAVAHDVHPAVVALARAHERIFDDVPPRTWTYVVRAARDAARRTSSRDATLLRDVLGGLPAAAWVEALLAPAPRARKLELDVHALLRELPARLRGRRRRSRGWKRGARPIASTSSSARLASILAGPEAACSRAESFALRLVRGAARRSPRRSARAAAGGARRATPTAVRSARASRRATCSSPTRGSGAMQRVDAWKQRSAQAPPRRAARHRARARTSQPPNVAVEAKKSNPMRASLGHFLAQVGESGACRSSRRCRRSASRRSVPDASRAMAQGFAAWLEELRARRRRSSRATRTTRAILARLAARRRSVGRAHGPSRSTAARFYLHVNVDSFVREPQLRARDPPPRGPPRRARAPHRTRSSAALEQPELDGARDGDLRERVHRRAASRRRSRGSTSRRFGLCPGRARWSATRCSAKRAAEGESLAPRPGTSRVDEHPWSRSRSPRPGRRSTPNSCSARRSRKRAKRPSRATSAARGSCAASTPDTLLAELSARRAHRTNRSTGRRRSKRSSRTSARRFTCGTGRAAASPIAIGRDPGTHVPAPRRSMRPHLLVAIDTSMSMSERRAHRDRAPAPRSRRSRAAHDRRVRRRDHAGLSVRRRDHDGEGARRHRLAPRARSRVPREPRGGRRRLLHRRARSASGHAAEGARPVRALEARRLRLPVRSPRASASRARHGRSDSTTRRPSDARPVSSMWSTLVLPESATKMSTSSASSPWIRVLARASHPCAPRLV